ncbi:MAG TPA: AbrB/MazE/SpoVT family DNA-binding domain-containing protein [Pyrinomonadaceae bacterium]|nr:AbrB/MazE/SpoVT family DNA-binding domain-containing protein [Pyrinomonadaceae bacterium]
MRKNLSAIGNSLGIVIEKPILELLNITRDTELEVTTDGSRLIIEPVRTGETEGRRGRVGVATKRVMKNHDRTLRRLAE